MAKKKEVESKKSIRKIDLISLYKEVFESDAGQQVLHDLMKSTLFFQTTFDSNPTVAAFNEGKRAMISDILNVLNKDPNKLYEQIRKQEEINRLYDGEIN